MGATHRKPLCVTYGTTLCYAACSEELYKLWKVHDFESWNMIDDDEAFLRIANLYCRQNLMDARSVSRLARHMPWPHHNATLMAALLLDAEKFKPLLCYSRLRVVRCHLSDGRLKNEIDMFSVIEMIDAIDPMPCEHRVELISFFCEWQPSDPDERYKIIELPRDGCWRGTPDALLVKHPITKRWRRADPSRFSSS
jgi:hypothetical protein